MPYGVRDLVSYWGEKEIGSGNGLTPSGINRNNSDILINVSIYKINSLARGKFELNFRYVIFKWILVTDGRGISCEIALVWMSLDFTDDQSALVQVMAWCRQPMLTQISVTGPEWVNQYLQVQCLAPI